jgi:uncharacterized protein
VTYREQTPADYKKAATLLQANCDAGDAYSCFARGEMHYLAQGGPRSYPKVVGFYQRACGLGLGAACYSLGIMLEKAEGVPQDEPRGASLHQQGCELKDAQSCNRLAEAYTRGGLGFIKDLEKAKDFSEKACQYGDKATCKALGK